MASSDCKIRVTKVTEDVLTGRVSFAGEVVPDQWHKSKIDVGEYRLDDYHHEPARSLAEALSGED